mmetsp:Transcript_119367/g.380669  ORF Transcript_119367/g.380669 Transcript_119367/m.380669 type:complete len:221 (-) Transcript_119367:515-1177(-)
MLGQTEVDEHGVRLAAERRNGEDISASEGQWQQLLLVIGAQHDVRGLDVAMDEAEGMHVHQSLEHLCGDIKREALGEPAADASAICDELLDAASRAELKAQEDESVILKVLVELDYVGVVQGAEMLDLTQDLPAGRYGQPLAADDLHCAIHFGRAICGNVDLSEGSRAPRFAEVVEVADQTAALNGCAASAEGAAELAAGVEHELFQGFGQRVGREFRAA